MKYFNLIVALLLISISPLISSTNKQGNLVANSIITGSDSIVKKRKRVFTKIFFTPQNTFRKKLYDKEYFFYFNYGDWSKIYSINSSEETSSFGYDFGIVSEIKIGKNFNINSGITIDKQGFKTKSPIAQVNYYEWGDVIGHVTGTIYNMPKIKFNFLFTSLPIVLNYELHKGSNEFYFGAGTEFKYLVRNSIVYPEKNTYANSFPYIDPTKTHTFTFFYIINAGVSRPITKKLSLFTDLNFKYQALPIITYPQYLNAQLWSLGCKIGIKF